MILSEVDADTALISHLHYQILYEMEYLLLILTLTGKRLFRENLLRLFLRNVNPYRNASLLEESFFLLIYYLDIEIISVQT